MDDIAYVELKLQLLIVYDDYERNRATSCFIIIDENSNNTIAVSMISVFNK